MSGPEATLALVERLYFALEERDAFAQMLEVVTSGLGGRQGFAVLAGEGDEHLVVAAQRGQEPAAANLVAAREGAWRTLFDGPAVRLEGDFGPERALLPFSEAVAVLVASHQDLGSSLWVVARSWGSFGPEARTRADVLASNLRHAGYMALARGRAPKGSIFRTATGDLGPLLRRYQQRPGTPIGMRVNDLFDRFAQSPRPEPGRGEGARRRRGLDDLPDLEVECARLAAEGYTNEAIALQKGISVTTVNRRLRRVYDALGIRGRHELNVAALIRPARDDEAGR
jgi:DNA-binding CsgD family transcriptional regulator